MNLTRIQELFKNVGLVRGSVFLLSGRDALQLIDECEKRGVDILGVEGFKVIGEKIQPFQEHSFDLYGVREDSHAVAREFIRHRLDSDIWFEVGMSDGEA
jgi:hypothetical protein